MARVVSEKTLELNVTAEILSQIRAVPGCAGAFWIGMKQLQEHRTGIDELISSGAAGFHLALQFKSPWRMPRDPAPLRFRINDEQTRNLSRLAATRPQAVWYVFPRYNTFAKVRLHSPDLLQDTWFLRVADLSGLAPAQNSAGAHRVECLPGRAVIHSAPFEVELLPVASVMGRFMSAPTDYLLTSEELSIWLRSVSGSEMPFGTGLFFEAPTRGFGTIFVPEALA